MQQVRKHTAHLGHAHDLGVLPVEQDQVNCVIRNLLQTVQADEHRGLPLPEALGRQPHGLVEVLAGRGRRLADDRLKDAREDGERRPVLLAVDVDRGDLLRRLLDLGKKPADGGGARRACR